MTTDQHEERIGAGLPPRISYADLNAKQKEIYNFQKVAALLADHGFNCIKLSDDWQGADFLAYHKDWEHTLRVQLKTSLTIASKYAEKGLHIAFHIHGVWHVIDHDALVDLCAEHATYLDTAAWKVDGLYTTTHPNPALRAALKPYALSADASASSAASSARPADAGSVDSGPTTKGKRFEVHAGTEPIGPLTQKHAVLAVVQLLVEAGVSCETIQEVLNPGPFRCIRGTVDPRDLWPAMAAAYELGSHEEKLWFLDEPVYQSGNTWVLRNNVWGKATAQKLGMLCDLAEGSHSANCDSRGRTTADLRGAITANPDSG
ncbi:hypothetical protein [Nocardioides sp. GY 10113]|uniref:hypothetical protein n=1 Tax=Nocardioides sp. GY 10113 TaxID=2569761 RepID=UPI0019824FE2|nr:hypothetical protein [Nocardioides sp. GY 10113]